MNLIGSLAIAFLAGALADRVLAAGAGRLLVTGASSAHAPPFRRSATNPSSALLQAGRLPAMLANIGLSVGGCLLAILTGLVAARALTPGSSKGHPHSLLA